MPFHIDKKRDRAWYNKALERAGLKRPAAPQRRATGGLLVKRIAALTPAHRVEVERLVSRLLAKQEEFDL